VGKKKNQGKALSEVDQEKGMGRRSFLKGATAAGVGLASAGATSFVGTSSAKAADKVQIKITSWMDYEPGRKEAWHAIFDKFNAQSTTTEISFGGWPFASFEQNVITGLQAGTLTDDLMMCTPTLAARLFKGNYLAPLTSSIKAAGVTPNKDLHKYITDASGEFHGVSIVTVNEGYLYNSDVYKKAGLKPPTTYAELLSNSAKLTKKPSKYGFFMPHIQAEEGDFWFNLQSWVSSNNGVWAVGNKPTVNSPANVKAIETWIQLIKSSAPQGVNNAAALALESSGRIGGWIAVSAAVNTIKASNPKTYALLRSVPVPGSHKAASRVHPITINKAGKNAANAQEFVTWILKPENMLDLTIRCLDFIPPYPELSALPAYKAYVKDLPWITGFLTPPSVPITPMQLNGGSGFVDHDPELGTIVTSNLTKALEGKATVQQALDAAQKEVIAQIVPKLTA
jgi:ABC-type glycerol-3-phosphate transport system substrate-binding protein